MNWIDRMLSDFEVPGGFNVFQWLWWLERADPEEQRTRTSIWKGTSRDTQHIAEEERKVYVNYCVSKELIDIRRDTVTLEQLKL